jgi:hypothetical protein
MFSGFRGVLIFFARFIAASVVLYAVYLKLSRYYVILVASLAKPLIALAGYEMVMERALKITEEISLNPIVFLSLVIAVPAIAIKRKLGAAALGMVILTVANSATVFLIFLSAYRESELLWTGTEFLNLTINFFLPILLWFLLLPIRSVIPAFQKR